MRKYKKVLAFTLAALQILMLLPTAGLSVYAEELEAVTESAESDVVEGAEEDSGVLASEGAEVLMEEIPVEEDTEEPAEETLVVEENTEVFDSEDSGVLTEETPVGEDAEEPAEEASIEEEEPAEDDAVFYTLKVVDIYSDTKVSDVRYEEQLPAGQGYSFSALEVDNYVVDGDAEYQGELTEDTTLEFVYLREYTVTFYDIVAEEVISEVTVKAGEAAEAPEVPEYEGFEFIGWSEDFGEVFSDLTVEAQYKMSGVSLFSEGTVLSNTYASAILYEDEKKLVVTGMFKSGSSASYYPWYGKISGYTVEFTDDVTTIGNYAFQNSGIVGDLVIPDSVTTIGAYAFQNCTGLTGDLRQILSGTTASIDSSAFSGCSSMKGELLSNAYASAFLYKDEKKLVVTGMFQPVDNGSSYPWYNRISGYTVEFTDDVTSIGAYAFYKSGIAGDLVFPDSITSIGYYAFYDCTGLTGELVLPDSVTSIGYYAFYDCTGFDGTLTLGSAVTSIGYNAFSSCSGFTGDLVIPDSVTTIEESAFSYCSGFTGDLVIPDSVTSIESGVFTNCSGFTGDLVIPDSVTSIGYGAFSGCTGFDGTLTLGNSVTTIGGEAFQRCSGLTGDLIIPDSVATIGNYAFSGCSGFKGTLTLGNSVTSIESSAFYGCSGFTGDLEIPDSVATIGNYAFQDCSGFDGTLTLGKSITMIGEHAFGNCSGLTGDLIIPDSVTSIGNWAFNGCSGFDGALTLGNSVTTIRSYTFSGCTGFDGTLTLGSSLTSIESNVFSNCSGFTGDLIIPDSVTSIGECAFDCCSGFDGTLTLGSAVTSIGGGAFRQCSGLTGNLVIPDSVTSIGECAFWVCSGFSDTLVLGKSLQSIGREAFAYCQNISIIRDESLESDFEFGYGYNGYRVFYVDRKVATTIYSEKPTMLNYDWDADNRVVPFGTQEYKVSFDSNGGTPVASQTLEKLYWDWDTEKLNGYAYVTEPETPTKEGCIFQYWAGNNGGYFSEVFFPYYVTSDITLYAVWYDPTITVTFDSQGGTPVASQELEKLFWSWDTNKEYGYAYISEPETPTKEGCELRYWATKSPYGDYFSEVSFPLYVESDITLYAVWYDPTETFTVTFDSQGGTPVASQEVLVNTCAVEPEAPTRDGYVFGFWSEYYYGNYPYYFESYVVDRDITLFARWFSPDEIYTVTFETYGGTPVESQRVFQGQSATEPEPPKREGYEFSGWFPDESFSYSYYFWNEVYSDITLYAKWVKSICKVTFDSQGGTPVDSQELRKIYDYWDTSYSNGYVYIAEPEVPTKEGCEFRYWYKEDEPLKAFNFSNAIYNTDEITLYAKWYDPSQPLMVVFNSNGGTPVETQYVFYGDNAVKPENPTKEGYEFLYWASDESLCYEYYFDSEEAKVTDDIVLYACWHKISNEDGYGFYCTVTFDENYDGAGCTYRSYYSGSIISRWDIPEPVRAGYVFGGWYRTKNPVFSGWAPDLSGTYVYEDMTFYALWISNDTTYNIKIYDVFYDESDIFERRDLRVDRDVRINEQYEYRALEVEGYRSEGYFNQYHVIGYNDTSYDFKYYKVDSRYPNIIRFFADGRLYETHGLEEYTDEFYMDGCQWVAVTPPETNPEKKGYIFKGWKADGYSFEVKLVDGELQSLEEDELIDFSNFYVEKTEAPYTVYAEWERKNTCTVEFNTNGGTPVASQEVIRGNHVKEPEAPTKEGCEFKYWYKEGEYGKAFSFATPIEEDTILHAMWYDPSQTFTVTFETNGGTPVASQQVVCGGFPTYPGWSASTKAGYDFKYWTLDEDCLYEYRFGASGFEIDRDTTLYAYWYNNSGIGTDAEYCTVTFDSMGGSYVAPKQVKRGSYLGYDLEKPVRDGYYFMGWYRMKNPYKPDTTYGLAYDPIYEDITVYAWWISNDTQVNIKVYDSFYGEDGMLERTDLRVDENVYVGDSICYSPLEVDGYKCTDTWDFEQSGVWSDVSYTFYYVKVTSENPCLIKFMANSATYAIKEAQETTSIDSNMRTGIVLPPVDPEKEGYVFKGWQAYGGEYKLVDGVKQEYEEDELIDFSNYYVNMSRSFYTLYAKFEKAPDKKYVITVIDEYYDVDGTTLLSSETRLSEELAKDSSYSYEALSTIGYKVLGQSSYTGTVTEEMTIVFKYAEDPSVLGGTLVISIPAEMSLAYDSDLGDYVKTDSVYASGRCGMKKRLDVETPQHITFVNNDDNSIVIENAKVTFGAAVSEDSTKEYWSAAELREGIGSPVGKRISVSVDKKAVDFLGSYSSIITYNISLVEAQND